MEIIASIIYLWGTYICIVLTLFLICLYIFRKSSRMIIADKNYCVLITGCDSGLGYSFAKHCSKLGMTVYAGCLEMESEGACDLGKLENVIVCHLDVTNVYSIRECLDDIMDHISLNPDSQLKAIVNNAGVMIFGEFHWYMDHNITNQIEVNLLGPMRVSKTFGNTLKKSKGRIINICSHCAYHGLPGLSVYAASKAGLAAWSESLRLEMLDYGVDVVTFIPGSFVDRTKILLNQQMYAEEMLANMPTEDREFFEDYFRRYNAYLGHIPSSFTLYAVKSDILYSNFEHALLSEQPHNVYCYTPWRYAIYHMLFKITPWNIHDKLVRRFMSMPSRKTK